MIQTAPSSVDDRAEPRAGGSITSLHTPVPLAEPRNWTLYVSHSHVPVKRLVMFVHGFRGRAVSTWLDFPSAGEHRAWWREADLLFVGYGSTRENISGVAHRIRREIPRFFPAPYPEAMTVNGRHPRPDITSAYEELFLIGHSLGGLVLRRALCDAAIKWNEDGRPAKRSPLLDARLLLFSPATAGFQASGILGAVRATGIWAAAEIFLRRSSAYSDLQPGSTLITDTRALTERLAVQPELSGLRARIVWANPDDVVIVQRYETDFVDDSWDGRKHSTICKPRADFQSPLDFVETGQSS